MDPATPELPVPSEAPNTKAAARELVDFDPHPRRGSYASEMRTLLSGARATRREIADHLAAQLGARQDSRLLSSWQMPSDADLNPGFWVDRTHNNTSRRIFLPLGPSGLSNGPNRADLVTKGKTENDPYANPGLVGRIMWRPGTTRFKISGKLAPRPASESTRGIIKELSKGSKRRLLELARELEASGQRPEWMLTLTWPGDWRAAFGDHVATCEALQAALVELAELAEWARAAQINLDRQKTNRPLADHSRLERQCETIREQYAQTKEKVKLFAVQCRQSRPDGKRIKALLNAFLKRFDRAHGMTTEAKCSSLNAAQLAADSLRPYYPDVKVRKQGERYHVVAIRYRMIWWLEFQRRGAPHLHVLFFDTQGLDFSAIRSWVGPAWAATVAGRRNVDSYLCSKVADAYNNERALWGREIADQTLQLAGLDPGLWRHIRAGTRLEQMEKADWRYIAAETSGGSSKRYQKRVPPCYQNIGRWWGYRKLRRAPVLELAYEIQKASDFEFIAKPLEAAINQIPKQAFKFKKKIERFMTALTAGQDFGYITIWGQAAQDAAMERVLN